LFLGASESIGSFTDLFKPTDKKYKIYSKKPALARPFQLPVKTERGGQPSSRGSRKPGAPLPLEAGRGDGRFTRRAQCPPPSVLINADLQILQFRGPTGGYLEPPTGKASFEVLKMARQGLMLPLRAAINKAKKENESRFGRCWTRRSTRPSPPASLCDNQSSRQRNWHSYGPAPTHLRYVHASRYLTRDDSRWAGHWPDLGEELGGTARRHLGRP
jgi:hypothetical protein